MGEVGEVGEGERVLVVSVCWFCLVWFWVAGVGEALLGQGLRSSPWVARWVGPPPGRISVRVIMNARPSRRKETASRGAASRGGGEGGGRAVSRLVAAGRAGLGSWAPARWVGA